MSALAIPLMMLALRDPVAGIIAFLLTLIIIYPIRKRMDQQHSDRMTQIYKEHHEKMDKLQSSEQKVKK